MTNNTAWPTIEDPSILDEEILSAMAWAKPQFTKAEIDRAGEKLLTDFIPVDDIVGLQEFSFALKVIDNWRAVHSYPLHSMKMNLKRRAKKVCPSAIVAQRLKRLPSIRLKLELSKAAGKHPNLSQMQDIGGCRAVVSTTQQVFKIAELFEDASKKNPKRGAQHYKTYNYIEEPKASGYRSLHLVYKFKSDSDEHSCYNGQRIEIQIRSRLQHSWATAVETYSTFSGEALKSNVGSEEWKRFFALVSSAIAMKEGCPPVPGTPDSMDGISPELKALWVDLKVHATLTGWSSAVKFVQEHTAKEMQDAAVYILALDPKEAMVTAYPYPQDRLAEANEYYAKIEKEQPDLQAVLVSVDSLAALRTAYPNYFFDTTSFVSLVMDMFQLRQTIGPTPEEPGG